MSSISFDQAMTFLEACPAGEKRALNKAFRDYCSKAYNQKLTVKEASPFIENYRDIKKACFELAVEHWHAREGGDYEGLIFSKYPPINSKLKSELIQNAHFQVFR